MTPCAPMTDWRPFQMTDVGSGVELLSDECIQCDLYSAKTTVAECEINRALVSEHVITSSIYHAPVDEVQGVSRHQAWAE